MKTLNDLRRQLGDPAVLAPAMILVLAAFGCGYWLRGARAPDDVHAARAALLKGAADTPAEGWLWACPMMDVEPRATAGRCPVCGMALVAIPGPGAKTGPPTLELSEAAARLADVRTAPVERRPVCVRISAFGQIVMEPSGAGFAAAVPYVARLSVFETDLGWIQLGQRVTMRTDAWPGRTFEGAVVFAGAVVDPLTRTVSVGVGLATGPEWLLPGMIVRAEIEAAVTPAVLPMSAGQALAQLPLVIPDSAPLIAGKRAVVYVAMPGKPGRFEGREIVLGPRAGDRYLVSSGLREGERVVVNGNFKIDSALQIRADRSLMGGGAGGRPEERR